jgi:hypothetical protein
MIATHRRAGPADAPQLLEVRQRSITILAPQGMPIAEVESWATKLSVAGMEQKIRALEIWVAGSTGERSAGLQSTAIAWRDFIRTRTSPVGASARHCSPSSKP